MEVQLGRNQDVDEWMKLVEEISWNFPGLETMEGLNEYRETLLRFIGKDQALCVRNATEVMLGAHKTGYNILSMIMASGSRG